MTTNFAKKSEKELNSLLSEKKQALRNFRFGVSGSSARNVREGRGLRRDMARILTMLNNKTSKL